MFLVMGDDRCNVPKKVIQYRPAMLGAELRDGAREHVLTLTRTQHVH